MIRNVIFLAALALVCVVLPAEARQLHISGAERSCVPTSDVMRPCAYQPNFLAGVKEIRVTMHRERHASNPRPRLVRQEVVYANPIQSFAASVSKPIRYIAGRLACAVNVNSALAERGIQGTGSALAHSFDHWGVRIVEPIAGAVAVTDRRGGGHVAIISRVEGSRIWAWNPSPRGRGWQEIEYTSRHARYRIAGS